MTEIAVEVRPTKRTVTTKPYLSWCLVVRNCARTLEATLQSIRERSPEAEIVIVETCSSDEGKTVEIAQKYADVFEVYKGPRGDWNSEMYAVDDMSAARKRSFDLANGTWRVWADGDDRIAGPEEAEKLLKINGQWKAPLHGVQKLRTEFESELGTGPVGLEDLLAWTEKNAPEVTCIWCPYLYQKDEKGHALQWLTRERFIKWDDPTRFFWAEAGHEILVPRAGYIPPRVDWPHLLWVHEKIWTGAEYDYSLQRHSDIILKQYDRGEITFRRARYLAGFATSEKLGLAHRELEFLNKAMEVAFTDMDRYRAHIALGGYYARRRLDWSSRDHLAAATTIRGDLSDAWYAAGRAAFDREDWIGAVENFRRGVKCPQLPESETNPRQHAVTFPSLLAVCLQRAAEIYTDSGRHTEAMALLFEAREIAVAVSTKPEVGSDKDEALALAFKAENAFRSQKALLSIHEAWQHLRNNDESAKAAALVPTIPFDKVHHPLAVEMERWAQVIQKHIDSPKAYSDFYNSSEHETGWAPLKIESATYEASHPRNKWAINKIKLLRAARQADVEEISVLDIGCCDGICGIPLLKEVDRIAYTGIDVGERYLDHFRKLVEENQIAPGINGVIGGYTYKTEGSKVNLFSGTIHSLEDTFDVILAGEIVEHVSNPVGWLISLRRRLNKNGTLLLTTPWGAFDEGHPPPSTAYGTPRDERGHLRAYSAWSMLRDLRAAGFQVSEVVRIPSGRGYGDAMCVTASKLEEEPGIVKRPLAVAVMGALWKWNGSLVDLEGIGASEEMIIRMGEKLSSSRIYDVFGPVPEEEVYKGVGYFPQAALRKIAPETKIIVSRAPGYVKHLDALTGRHHPAILWLQDTIYPDLTPEIAARYEKIVCVSEWHATLTKEWLTGRGAAPWITENVISIYNWIDRGHFEDGMKIGWEGLKKPHHFIYASSPDRGIVKLLELWPRILEMYPDATLSVFYGWRGAAKLTQGSMDGSNWNQRYLSHRRRYEELRHQRGVQEIGMVNHYRVALEFQKASVWPYPTDFHETCCTNAIKARAAGCVPVASALAGLNETAGGLGCLLVKTNEDGKWPEGYDEEFLRWVETAVEMGLEHRKFMAEEAIKNFSWEAIEPKWREIL